MRTMSLRGVAVALGVGVYAVAQLGAVAHGEAYTSPARWNNFRPVSDNDQAAAKKAIEAIQKEVPEPVAELPAPVPEPMESVPEPMESVPEPMESVPEPMELKEPASDASEGSVYEQAMSSTWEGCPTGACRQNARLPLSPWFGGANLLFLTLDDCHGRPVASGLGSGFTTTIADPSGSTGFDASIGRYLHCGQYALGVTYMLWDPSAESVIRTASPGTIVAQMPTYNNISVDAGSGIEPVYTIIDGTGAYAGAAGVRVRRDMRFQGIEANMFCFGLMGSRRVSYANCNSCGLLGGRFGNNLLCNRCKGYSGAMGALTRPCSGRVRVMASHGFRWFQIDDEYELGYNINGTVGYQADDLYENVDVTNNLYGYQFGDRLIYCISCRLSANIGGKIGIYGNHAQMRHRVGTNTAIAYRNGVGTDLIDTESSDTKLASLGELDLGLGYRLGCAWTLRGGYRLIGITGVADATRSLPTNYVTLADSAQVHANDSFIIHGGYVGLEYNW